MFDPNTFKRRRITLDWDFSQFEQLRKYLRYCIGTYFKKYPIRSITVWTSPLKGFHVEIWFVSQQLVAKVRNDLKDDGMRLTLDIMRKHSTHDVCWNYKTHNGIKTGKKEIVFRHDHGMNTISNLF